MRKLILKHILSPGDVAMFTAAVPDLHLRIRDVCYGCADIITDALESNV